MYEVVNKMKYLVKKSKQFIDNEYTNNIKKIQKITKYNKNLHLESLNFERAQMLTVIKEIHCCDVTVCCSEPEGRLV